MERANFTGVYAVLCVALSVGAARAADAAPDRLPEFSVRSLSVWTFGQPRVGGVNDRGSAFGSIATRVGSDIRHDAFFRDRHGNQQFLGHLPGGRDYTGAIDINEHDWIVGYSDAADGRSSHSHATAWNERDGLIDLGTLGGTTSWADGINDHNQVVGWADTTGERRAFIWEQGRGMRALTVPAGSGTSTAHDISNKGTIAGHTYLSGGSRQHANIWTRDGRFIDLGDLPGGHEEAAAFAVNEKDHVVGYSITDQGHRAFFWSEETGMINLGSDARATEGSVAHDINDKDWVVGRSRSPGTTATGIPFLWSPDWGLLDLNDLLDEGSREWKLYEAPWVNDRGDILAIGQLGAEYHMVMLSTHTPEPGGVLLLGAAGATLLLGRRR